MNKERVGHKEEDTLCGQVKMQRPTTAVKDVTGGPYKTEIKDGRFVSYHNNTVDNPVAYGANLKDAVTAKWATPDVSDRRGPGSNQVGPSNMVKDELWPTASVCGNHNRKGASESSGDGLSTLVKQSALHPDGSPKLNPRWVETLMGLPVGWTRPGCDDPRHPLDPARDRSEDKTVDNRTDELRMLGNGVVPATAELAFRTLLGRFGC
jgi:hypothetical protein